MPKVAIFFHLGNHSLWPFFKGWIDNVYYAANISMDLYVSYQDRSPVIDQIAAAYPATIFVETKLGLDIGGKMALFAKAIDKEYDYFLSIHTKSNPGWRNDLITHTCITSDYVNTVMSWFQNPTIGMIGAPNYLFPLDNLNHSLLEKLCSQWGLTYRLDGSITFVAGTIFWMRWSPLKRFFKEHRIDINAEYSKFEPGYFSNLKPTHTHSWERMFGIINSHYGYKCYGSPPTTLTPSDFNPSYYGLCNPDLMAIDPSPPFLHSHWLNHGIYEGRPYRSRHVDRSNFDWQIYAVCNTDLARMDYTPQFLTTHWTNHGISECRPFRLVHIGIPGFDWQFYVSHYSDLTFMKSYEEAIRHFATFGRVEGRRCHR